MSQEARLCRRSRYTVRATGGRRVTDTPTERAAESIWTSLRRRKVVQWGLPYLAGAWALLQAVVDGEIVAFDAHGSAGLRQ